MNVQDAFEYLKSQRVGVLAIETENGPHAATVHFAHTDDPFAFIYLTEKESKKLSGVIKNSAAKASFVVGSTEEDMKTFQADGVVEITDNSEYIDPYLDKFGGKKGKSEDPSHVFIVFKPIWWRFSDWNRPEGKSILTSDGTLTVIPKQ